MTDKPPIVFSTDSGRMCPECGISLSECSCKSALLHRVLGDGVVRVSRSTKGRKGKGVSIISGLPVNEEELKCIAKDLKRSLGVGGAVKGGTIEIQSDHREKILELLESRGFNGKLAG